MSTGKDGLFTDNVWPSLYVAKQGKPVKVWGFLASGHLCTYVLPADGEATTHMNGLTFQRVVDTKFKQWLQECWGRRRPPYVRLIQDHERCLWHDTSLEHLRAAGVHVVKSFPKQSPDLNVIEGICHEVPRTRLDVTSPQGVATRENSLLRLGRAKRWLNTTRRQTLLDACRSLPERAADVLAVTGARTRW